MEAIDNNTNMGFPAVPETNDEPFPPQPEVNPDNTINTMLNNNNELLTAVNNFVEGEFEYLPWYNREMYRTAWQAITQLELWDFMKHFDGVSFMLSHDRNVERIYSKIEELGYDGHSGASFGCTMRTMESIAIHGEMQLMLEYFADRNNITRN